MDQGTPLRSRFRPSATEERWLAVGADAGRTGGWRDAGFLARCGLFSLGALTAGLFTALVELLGRHHGAWFFALLMLAGAELSIVSRRVFASGFEEALEAAGAGYLVFSLHASGSAAAGLWLLGGAVGIAGLRLLNPLFTTAGVATCIAALAAASSRFPIATCTCYAVAALALAASTVMYQRPSYDRMLGWLVVAMPLGASVAASTAASDADRLSILTLVLAAMLGGAALSVGISRRLHAPLLAFLVCVLCIANELRKISRLPLDARLIVGGCVALGAAIVVDRYLRNGRNGITSRAVGSKQATPLDLIQLAGVQIKGSAALTTQSGTSGDRFRGGGGTFGGGGASGKF